MKVIRTNAVLMVIGLLLSLGAKGITPDNANPYQGIIDRNVFALKPPPVAGKDSPKDANPPPKITLTGITTILGKKQALMNVAMPAKPPEPAKQQSFIIAMGQRDGDIEVLDIDEKIGSVKLNNFGTEMLLTMEKDGAKLPASVPAAMPVMGGVNATGAVPPANAANPYAPAAANAGLKPLPTRQLRLGDNTGSTPYNPNVNASAGFNATPGVNGTPTTGLNLVQPGPGAYAQPHQGQIPQPQAVNPDEQAINMLAQHQQNMDQGIPMPPLPPPLAEVFEGPKHENTPAPVQQNNNQQFFPPVIPGQPTPPRP